MSIAATELLSAIGCVLLGGSLVRRTELKPLHALLNGPERGIRSIELDPLQSPLLLLQLWHGGDIKCPRLGAT